MKKTSLLFPVFALLLNTSMHLRAQVIYDNGSAALGMGNMTATGDFADTGSGVQTEVGDVITPTTSGTANVINFSGIFYNGDAPGTPPSTNTFLISLYELDPGTAPNTNNPHITSLVSGLIQTDLGAGNSRDIYSFSGFLDTPLTLTAGKTYFLGISDTTSPYKDFAVSKTANPTSDTGYAIPAGATNFGSEGSAPLSFSLAVPEPNEWALALMGGVAFLIFRGFVRRRV